MYVESCMILVVVHCLSRPVVVLNGLPGLYGFKYDSATTCGTPLYLYSYKLVGFKRGLGTKLMKTMANSRCATYNEFISDALTQENHNNMHAIAKGRKRAYEAGASGSSQSKAPIIARPQFRPPAPKFRPPPPKAQNSRPQKPFCKAFTIALPKGTGS